MAVLVAVINMQFAPLTPTIYLHFIIVSESSTWKLVTAYLDRRQAAIKARCNLAAKYGAKSWLGPDDSVKFLVFEDSMSVPSVFEQKDLYPGTGNEVVAQPITNSIKQELREHQYRIPGCVELHQLLNLNPLGVKVSHIGSTGNRIEFAFLSISGEEIIVCVPKNIDNVDSPSTAGVEETETISLEAIGLGQECAVGCLPARLATGRLGY